MKQLAALVVSLGLLAPSASAYTLINGRLSQSEIYPGTTHDYIISLPEGYDGSPACLYIGLDGILCNAPETIDSLSASGEIPNIIGVYLQPGVITDADGEVLRYNRSNEFDATDARFSIFLETELRPAISSTLTPDGLKVNIKEGGEHAMIFGLSSGGIAAFTAAWHRPDLFGRVFSGCGTFVPMRGADGLQAIVRKHEPKPLRIFLQDGYNDTWNPLFGSWFAANTMLGTALEFAGYDCAFDWAEGGHSVRRASEIFPEVMKWIWRDYPSAPSSGTTSNATLAPWLEGGGEWQERPASHYEPRTGALYPDGRIMALPAEGSNYLLQSIIDADGNPYATQAFYWLHNYTNGLLRIGGMDFDGDGNLWVATDAGIQVCDQNGRVRAIFDLPRPVATKLASNPANILSPGRLEIADGEVRLHIPTGTYVRQLGVKGAVEGIRPPSQGQG